MYFDIFGVPVPYFIGVIVLIPFLETIIIHGIFGRFVFWLTRKKALLTACVVGSCFALLHAIEKGWDAAFYVAVGGGLLINYVYYYLLAHGQRWSKVLFWTFVVHAAWNLLIYAKLAVFVVFGQPLP